MFSEDPFRNIPASNNPRQIMKAQAQRNITRSSAKTLQRICAPRDLLPAKEPEVVIEFSASVQTNEPDADRLNNVEPNKPTGELVIWYHTLGETEQQIKGLRLHAHETLGYPPFVILNMNDGSSILLELSQGKRLQSIDVVRFTDSELECLHRGSICVDFLHVREESEAFVNLKFAIAVCREFLAHISGSAIIDQVQLCSRLFAITLFVSIVRQRLPINKHLTETTHTVAAVDNLWTEILSKFAGQHLWENEIVERVHQIARTNIRLAAHNQLAHFVFFPEKDETQPQTDNGGKPNAEKKRKHLTESVVAWLESTIQQQKPRFSNLWDMEWDKTWSTEWEKNLYDSLEFYSKSRYTDIIREPISFVPPTSAQFGRTAGRALIEFQSIADSIPAGGRTALAMFMALHTEESSGSIINHGGQPQSSEGSSSAGGVNDKVDSNIQVEGKPTISHRRGQSWFGSWYSIQRPDLGSEGKWLPVWEAARNLSWAIEWAKYSENECPTPPPVQETNTQSHDTISPTVPPSADPIATSRPQLSQSRRISDGILPPFLNSNSIDIQGRLIKWLPKFNRPLDAHIPEKKFEPNLRELSKHAWDKANELDPKLGQTIREQGGKAFEKIDALFPKWMVQPLDKDLTIKAFEKALEETWRASWEKAWEKLMEDTAKGLESWMHVDDASQNKFLPTNVHDLKLEGCKALAQYMGSGSSEGENHWHIRSAFKALNLLHRLTAHSVPICYKGATKISRFVDRPYTFEYAASAPNSKGKVLNKTIQQDGKGEEITHKVLQDTIQRWAQKATSKLLPDYDPIAGMALIYEEAIRANADPNFMSNDPKTPWSEREAQIEAHLKRKKALQVRALWRGAMKRVLRPNKAGASSLNRA